MLSRTVMATDFNEHMSKTWQWVKMFYIVQRNVACDEI